MDPAFFFVHLRPWIMLALLLLFQAGPQISAASSGAGHRECAGAESMTCCSQGACLCASGSTEPTPAPPFTVSELGRGWAARPPVASLVDHLIAAIAPRLPHWHPARASEQQSNAVAVPLTVLHCTFLI